jgi:PIN domain nuclease of toxin-antitoxin system
MVNLLLDTHALLWFLVDDHHLKPAARQLMADPMNEVFVSAASAWEIAIKASLGKLTVPPDVATWLPAQLLTTRLTPLPISVFHAAAVERLPAHHADPFDRLLIVQAVAEHLTIVTRDPQFQRYEVRLTPC